MGNVISNSPSDFTRTLAMLTLPASLSSLLHPTFTESMLDWRKYRLTAEGGSRFVENYVVRLGKRELEEDFNIRKQISYCSAHSKAALIEIKNAIYHRLAEVRRIGGSESYRHACDQDVDGTGRSMTNFIGCQILPELIALGKVGVYIDRDSLESDDNYAVSKSKSPYIYKYDTENILNWQHNRHGKLTALLLRDSGYVLDDETGLPTTYTNKYRFYSLKPNGVKVIIYDHAGIEESETILNLTMIPFVIFQLSQSLLKDVCDHQIAITNLASSDMNYAVRSNVPFYTEQYDPMADMFTAPSVSENQDPNNSELPYDGTADQAATSGRMSIEIGSMHGRRYPKNMDRPDFIAPPTEPLQASMDKQSQIRAEIRMLVNLALTNIEPRRESADSKREDRTTKEEGLGYIGLELQAGERLIAEIWADYEKTPAASINYPRNYSLRTEDDRRQEAKELNEILPKIPSKTFQKEIVKEVTTILLGHKINSETLQTIHNEIQSQNVIVTDPEVIKTDLEAGLVSTETASKARLYPEGEVAQAKIDHAERAKRIALAQASIKDRGVNDNDPNPAASGRADKEASRNNRELDPNNEQKTRGAGQ